MPVRAAMATTWGDGLVTKTQFRRRKCGGFSFTRRAEDTLPEGQSRGQLTSVGLLLDGERSPQQAPILHTVDLGQPGQHFRHAESIDHGYFDATGSLSAPSSHVKRDLNTWADELTQPHPTGFNPAKRLRTSAPLRS